MLLRQQCDLTNVMRGLTAPFIFLYPYFFGFHEGYAVVTTLILWAVLNDINHVLHLHIHRSFSDNKYFNFLLDICMGITTGMTASNWRIQHKYGHHKHHTRTEKDEWDLGKDWETKKYSILGALSYSMRTIWPIFYRPLVESFNKGIIKNINKPINYRYAFLEQLALILFVVAMFIFQPEITLYYLMPWYFFVYFVTRYVDYLNHVNCGSNIFDSSNNSLNHWYNKLGCNFGYHTAHHHKPGAHWSTLPEIHNKISGDIPPSRLKKYSWSGFLMPYHFYLSLKGRM